MAAAYMIFTLICQLPFAIGVSLRTTQCPGCPIMLRVAYPRNAMCMVCYAPTSMHAGLQAAAFVWHLNNAR